MRSYGIGVFREFVGQSKVRNSKRNTLFSTSTRSPSSGLPAPQVSARGTLGIQPFYTLYLKNELFYIPFRYRFDTK